MKFFLVLLTLILGQLKAQDPNIPLNEPNYNKPRLFGNLPSRIFISVGQIEQLLHSSNGQTIQVIDSSSNTIISGKVLSVVGKNNDTIRTVLISCDSFANARLTITRVRFQANNRYTGHIISFEHGDVYELKLENNQWFFVKKDIYDIISE